MRLEILNKLITDFTALEHSPTKPLFASVKKVFVDDPTSYPVCVIQNVQTGIDSGDNSNDLKSYEFEAVIFEPIDKDITQSIAELRIDRLSQIEDVVCYYIHRLPSNLEGDISGVLIVKTYTNSVQYAEIVDVKGRGSILTINFTVQVNSYVR